MGMGIENTVGDDSFYNPAVVSKKQFNSNNDFSWQKKCFNVKQQIKYKIIQIGSNVNFCEKNS
jgi:hypothetical protein